MVIINPRVCTSNCNLVFNRQKLCVITPSPQRFLIQNYRNDPTKIATSLPQRARTACDLITDKLSPPVTNVCPHCDLKFLLSCQNCNASKSDTALRREILTSDDQMQYNNMYPPANADYYGGGGVMPPSPYLCYQCRQDRPPCKKCRKRRKRMRRDGIPHPHCHHTMPPAPPAPGPPMPPHPQPNIHFAEQPERIYQQQDYMPPYPGYGYPHSYPKRPNWFKRVCCGYKRRKDDSFFEQPHYCPYFTPKPAFNPPPPPPPQQPRYDTDTTAPPTRRSTRSSSIEFHSYHIKSNYTDYDDDENADAANDCCCCCPCNVKQDCAYCQTDGEAQGMQKAFATQTEPFARSPKRCCRCCRKNCSRCKHYCSHFDTKKKSAGKLTSKRKKTQIYKIAATSCTALKEDQKSQCGSGKKLKKSRSRSSSKSSRSCRSRKGKGKDKGKGKYDDDCGCDDYSQQFVANRVCISNPLNELRSIMMRSKANPRLLLDPIFRSPLSGKRYDIAPKTIKTTIKPTSMHIPQPLDVNEEISEVNITAPEIFSGKRFHTHHHRHEEIVDEIVRNVQMNASLSTPRSPALPRLGTQFETAAAASISSSPPSTSLFKASQIVRDVLDQMKPPTIIEEVSSIGDSRPMTVDETTATSTNNLQRDAMIKDLLTKFTTTIQSECIDDVAQTIPSTLLLPSDCSSTELIRDEVLNMSKAKAKDTHEMLRNCRKFWKIRTKETKKDRS